MREYKKRLREESQQGVSDAVTSKHAQLTDGRLWARLDELEKLETERRELERWESSTLKMSI